MLHSTPGIVLRTIRYGETSIVTTVYTELFGVQSYLVNGVRTEKKSASKANLYQPASQLDLVVYHQPNKNLQRIREARMGYYYRELSFSVIRNTIAVYVSELIYRTITEPEGNPELYHFIAEALQHIDTATEAALADFPILFTLDLAAHLGFAIQPPLSGEERIFDLINGRFIPEHQSEHPYLLSADLSGKLLDVLLERTHRNHLVRKELLEVCIQYLRHHIPHMQELRSPEVLHAVLS